MHVKIIGLTRLIAEEPVLLHEGHAHLVLEVSAPRNLLFRLVMEPGFRFRPSPLSEHVIAMGGTIEDFAALIKREIVPCSEEGYPTLISSIAECLVAQVPAIVKTLDTPAAMPTTDQINAYVRGNLDRLKNELAPTLDALFGEYLPGALEDAVAALEGAVATTGGQRMSVGEMSAPALEVLQRIEIPEPQTDTGRFGPDAESTVKGYVTLQSQVGGSHYKKYAIEPIVLAVRNGYDGCASSILRYICRWAEKDGQMAMRKAYHYAQIRAELNDEFAAVIPQTPHRVPIATFIKENQIPGGDADLLIALDHWVEDGSRESAARMLHLLRNRIENMGSPADLASTRK